MTNLYASNAGEIVTSVTSLTGIPSPVIIVPLAAARRDVRLAAIYTTVTIWFGTRKLKIMCALNAIKTMNEGDANQIFDKMLRLAALIKTCDDWLSAEAPKHLIPGNRILDTWLFESKKEWLNRYRLKQQVRQRLLQYYIKLRQTRLKLIINQ